MDPRERILAAMHWEEPDLVPLTIYDWMIPRGTAERRVRELGLGLVVRLPAHCQQHKEVTYHTREYWDAGRHMQRRTIHTPVGEVSELVQLETAYGSSWIREHYIKEPQDYAVMEFVYRDLVYSDNYAAIRQAQMLMGGDGLVFVRVAKGPIQEMLYLMMGMERYSIDLYERVDLVDSLYHVMAKRYDELYALAAEAPVEILQAADNITSDVVGAERFRKYCMPTYARQMEFIEGNGKRLCVHIDGRVRSISPLVAEAKFDIVEAFTPVPVGDMSVAEGRQAWPKKALWLNFPSSVHIEPDDVIAAQTRTLIEQAGTKRGLAIGITEDIPLAHAARSLTVIANTIREMG